MAAGNGRECPLETDLIDPDPTFYDSSTPLDISGISIYEFTAIEREIVEHPTSIECGPLYLYFL